MKYKPVPNQKYTKSIAIRDERVIGKAMMEVDTDLTLNDLFKFADRLHQRKDKLSRSLIKKAKEVFEKYEYNR